MSSIDRNNFDPATGDISLNSRGRSLHLWIQLVAVGATLAVGIGTLLINRVYVLQDRACINQNERLHSLEKLNEVGPKLQKLKGFIADPVTVSCGLLDYAKDQFDALSNTPQPQSLPPAPLRPPASPTQAPPPKETASITPPAPSPLPLDTPAPADAAPAPPPIQYAPSQQAPTGPSPPNLSGGAQPDIVVTPAPASVPVPEAAPADQPTAFEGDIGESLFLVPNVPHELKPRRSLTTTYIVTRGEITVTIDNKISYICEKSNRFRFFWQNVPNYIVIANGSAAEIRVENIETGKHLDGNDCRYP